jgi:hypothetical protein
MAKTVEELVEFGLSKAEAERVVNRAAKAEAKASSTIATAEKRLPKAKEQAAHAADRAKHWAEVSAKADAKVAKYEAIISGESTEDVPDEEADDASE